MAEIGDVIELTVDIPERNLRAGAQGTIVHLHNNLNYEVEFTDEAGETVELMALNVQQLIVVWRAETQQWVPIEEQVAAIINNLPSEAAQEVLDFARFLSARQLTANRPTVSSRV